MYINSMTPTKKNLFQKIIKDRSCDSRKLKYSYGDINVKNDTDTCIKNET